MSYDSYTERGKLLQETSSERNSFDIFNRGEGMEYYKLDIENRPIETKRDADNDEVRPASIIFEGDSETRIFKKSVYNDMLAMGFNPEIVGQVISNFSFNGYNAETINELIDLIELQQIRPVSK